MITLNRIQEICRNNDYLTGKAGNAMSYAQDLANFCLPRKAWINSIRYEGERLKDNFLYDVRAIRAAKKSCAGFYSHLTNPSTRWNEIISVDTKMMQSGANQRYFRECSNIQYDVMNASNFGNSIIEGFMDGIVFGTANTMILDDDEDEVRYMPIPYEQSNYEEDSRGRVCAVYRNFRFTAAQCWERWGMKCSKEIIDAINDGKYFITFDLLHYVGKRHTWNPYMLDRVSMPRESIWLVKKGEHLLEEGGFMENPYAVWRFWRDSNDPRGFSPAMDVLAAIKLLNAQKRTFIRAAMKKSDPAMMMPNRGWLNAPNFNPSAMNYYDAKHTNPDALRPIENH